MFFVVVVLVFFPREQVGFRRKTNLLPGQKILLAKKPNFRRIKMVFGGKTTFCLGKTTRTILLKSGGIVSLIFFWFSPRKKLVFGGKSRFFLGKVCISLQDQTVPSKNCVFHWLFVHVTKYCCKSGSGVIAIGTRFRLALISYIGNNQ